MTQDIKDEVTEQLHMDIQFGFENELQLFDSIRDMFYNEDDFDEEWLRLIIAEKYNVHQKQSLNWKRPTDFDRLVKVFDELIEQKIVCLHKAGYTKQDGEADCMEAIEELRELGINAFGFCYYHEQDLGRAIDPECRNLLLGFDSPAQNDREALDVANRIVTAFQKNNFEISWPGTVDQRIEIKNITWQKTPDNEDWGTQRVISILTKKQNAGKPFWKFW
ncbi:hypothetical protein QWZ08_08035 [Ferruginibacter paludis]|uniref:DUF6891 domain-containing protein n=1 Tax=Ferruginibacter paludis TaxID=1310417 RepID=UPI0025B3ED2A|nr:hypothetical protein [Ferruginibacter paludis]MDN3655571.1 hypothetical protein [Ferruginibacter paludis]